MDPAFLRPLLQVLLAPGMHSAAAARLLRAFGGDPDRVRAAPREEAASVPGVGPALAAALADAAASEDEADREAARARDLGLRLVGPGEEGYPPNLLLSYDPPPLLWVKGGLLPGDRIAVSVVGSRRASAYGAVQAARFGRGLAAAGVAVVSGLARGVDTGAHRGALEAPGGRTLAVLGSGHARPYPSENRPLLEEVASRGAVISEFPLDAPPLPHHFPMRNRVIAALGLGTVVVEAGRGSGSLITAGLASECGRTVFAVPGRVDAPNSRGVHALLRDGAVLAESPEDVLEELGIPAPAAAAAPAAAGPARLVLEALSRAEGTLDGDALAAATGLPAGDLRAALVDLELGGAVRAFPGGRFAKS